MFYYLQIGPYMALYSNLESLFHHNGLHNQGFVFETIASTTSYLLNKAEKEFGERDKSYTLIGVEYASPGVEAPHTRFSGYDPKHMMIVLSSGARTFINAALFELSHEVFHLLSPMPSTPAPMIEEGAATYFCGKMSSEMNVQTSRKPARYEEAFDLFTKLHKCNPRAVSELRKRHGSLFFLKATDIIAVAPDLDLDIAHRLTENFKV